MIAMAAEELENDAKELSKQLAKEFPKAFTALADAHDNHKPIWIKKGNEIIECPYYPSMEEILSDDFSIDNYNYWYVTVGMLYGEKRLLIEVHSCKDYAWHLEHLQGINYFPERYLIRDFGETWWLKEQGK